MSIVFQSIKKKSLLKVLVMQKDPGKIFYRPWERCFLGPTPCDIYAKVPSLYGKYIKIFPGIFEAKFSRGLRS